MARTKQEKTDFETTLLELEKRHGMNRVNLKELTVISTGSLQLNQAMRIGGTALGKMYEVFGENSCGKSTLMLHQISEYQKAFPDRRVALMDFENTFDLKYATAIGVDVDKLLIYQPTTMEQGYDLTLSLIQKDIVSCVVIDSQTAAMPKAVLEGEMGDSTIGLQARLNSKFCQKVKGELTLHNVTLFFVSQTRSNIGGYGDGQVSTGGAAIKFYSDVRWKIWKTANKEKETNITTIDVIKSKVGKPFGQAKVNILWGVGMDKIGEVIDYAVEFGFIEKGGAGWFTIAESKFQGMDKVKTFLEDNPEYYEELKERVIKSLKGTPVEEVEEVDEE